MNLPDPPDADDLRAEITNAFENTPPIEDAGDQAPAAPPSEPVASEPGTPPVAGDRARDAQGRFIARDPSQIADQAVQRASTAVPAGPQQTPAVAGVPAGPPPGWSPKSKVDYAKLPDHIKNDIAKREAEISNGFAKLAEYRGLDPYVEMARNSNTTLPEALSRYVNAENALEADPIRGLLWLCERYQVHPAHLVQAITGEGDQQPQPPDPMAPYLQAFDQRLGMIEQEREQAEDYAISSNIQAFAQDPANKYFENVRHAMAAIIRQAPQNEPLTLKDVYDRACWLNPEVREALISERGNGHARERRRADQIRAAGSLSPGSPVSDGHFRAEEPAATLRDEIVRAWDAQRV